VERYLSLFGLGLTDFAVVLTLRGICWLWTGYTFPSTHFFRRESLLALLSVKREASYVAFKMVHCNVYVLCLCVFPHPLSISCLWQGVKTRFSVLLCSFVRGILVHIVYSATPFSFVCWKCILHVSFCCSALCVTCSVVCALEYFVLSVHFCSQLICACVMVGGNTYVLSTVTQGLHVWVGI